MFERGKTVKPLEVVGSIPEQPTGTKVTFFPDATIFTETIVFQTERLAKRMRELSFLNPGLTIELIDERPETESTQTFYYAQRD